jgi:N-acetyl-beta-hexosaminidase
LHLSSKVQSYCEYAAFLGFKWVWIDTCCIDKSSSTELSEAINSMYKWYANAKLCMAFLDDVPDGDDPRRKTGSRFLWSKWFTRGWTLQELVAPRNVMFLFQGWHSLGTKSALASTIETKTGIDLDVLCHCALHQSWSSQDACHGPRTAPRRAWKTGRTRLWAFWG